MTLVKINGPDFKLLKLKIVLGNLLLSPNQMGQLLMIPYDTQETTYKTFKLRLGEH